MANYLVYGIVFSVLGVTGCLYSLWKRRPIYAILFLGMASGGLNVTMKALAAGDAPLVQEKR